MIVSYDAPVKPVRERGDAWEKISELRQPMFDFLRQLADSMFES
jgi:hypothetical protein